MPPSTPTLADAMNMSSRLRSLVQAPKPEITFQMASKKKTYSTLDAIEGTVTIVPAVDTNFDGVEIHCKSPLRNRDFS